MTLGHCHGCGLLAGGGVMCWGDNDLGELGNGTEARTPARVRSLPDVVEVVAGAAHTCARTADGDVWCWGDNRKGQIGPTAPAAAREAVQLVW
jgi:alpha-tubulin suppressor-like RCC1 family protein